MSCCNRSNSGDGLYIGKNRKHTGVEAIWCTKRAAGAQYGNMRRYAARVVMTAENRTPRWPSVTNAPRRSRSTCVVNVGGMWESQGGIGVRQGEGVWVGWCVSLPQH